VYHTFSGIVFDHRQHFNGFEPAQVVHVNE
jgi:hypothetical protein